MADIDKFVTLYPKGGGEALRRHRVDAKDMLATGEYTLEPGESLAQGGGPRVHDLHSTLPPTAEPTADDIGFIPDLAASAVTVLRKAGIHTVTQLKETPMEDIEQLELSGRATEMLRKVKDEG